VGGDCEKMEGKKDDEREKGSYVLICLYIPLFRGKVSSKKIQISTIVNLDMAII
jgi:hypothetical protein